MRCHICDKALTDTEVSWNKDLGSYEPCSTCLDVALEAAYSDGFRPTDDSGEPHSKDDYEPMDPSASYADGPDQLTFGWLDLVYGQTNSEKDD